MSIMPAIYEKEWVDMPEFNNNLSTPEVVAVFKFKTKEDFIEFKGLINKYLSVDGIKFFNGGSTLSHKSTWWPKEANIQSHKYIDKSEVGKSE